MTTYDVVVIGGGISGLGAAYRLRSLRPQTRICVVEAGKETGGKLVSLQRDGFVVEGGPDGFLTRKPIVLDLVRELGLTEKLIEPKAEHRFSHILSGGELHRMPEGFSGLVPGNIDALRRSDIVSPEGVARAAAERTLAPKTGTEEESVSHFFRRRFGSETFEKLIEPLVSGIFVGDPDQLSAEAAFPQLVAIEKEGKSLLDSMGARSTPGADGSRPAFNSFSGGMADLPKKLAQTLRNAHVDIHTDSQVLAVEKVDKGGFSGESGPSIDNGFIVRTTQTSFYARSLILALSPPDSAAVLQKSFPALAAVLGQFPMASVAQLALAFSAEMPLSVPSGSGFVVSLRERKTLGIGFSAATWSSQKWPSRAPDGYQLLRFYFGGIREPELWRSDEKTLLDFACTFLARWNGGHAPVPVWHQLFRWENAIPQLNVGHAARLAKLDAEQRSNPGLFLTGSYFGGVGIPDSLDRAFKVAVAVSDFLD